VLEQVRGDLEQVNASAQLRFRVAANLGACSVQQDDLAAARREFEAAYALQPNSVKALTNLGLVDLLDGNAGGALALTTRALAIDTHSGDAMALHLMALRDLGQTDRIAAIVAEQAWIGADATCTHVLGEIAQGTGRLDEAEMWLRRSLELDADEPQTRVRLALALMGQVQAPAYEDPPVTDQARRTIASRLEEAEAHLTAAIERFRRTEDRGELHRALVNRAAVRAMLFRFDDALDDARRVLLDNPDPDIADAARNNEGRVYLITDRPR
jgi:tetratricopeptide (TPR) repeat protein